jgi:hypothetical protein
MRKGKFGQDLSQTSDSDFADFLLKFAYMTPEQMEERDALPTREARKAYMKNLPLPKIGG